jgi:hypothetical protein
MWVLFHLDDLDADFRVFYRLDLEEALELPGPRFLALAQRVTAYSGVMSARVEAQHDEDTPSEPGEVESSAASLTTNAAFADLIDYG